MKVIGVVGWKNNGKTTLVEGLVSYFVERGLKVSTVKHAHHNFDIDHKGKDSYRHRTAGAHEVIVASNARWALIHELRGEREPELEDLLAHLAPVDLVVVEGFKNHAHPKVEVILDSTETPLFRRGYPNIVAIASKNAVLSAPLPVLALDDHDLIARFILDYVGMSRAA